MNLFFLKALLRRQLMTTKQLDTLLKNKPDDNVRAEGYELAYKEDFNWTDIKQSDWTPGFVYPSDDYQPVHSYTNEEQAYVGGKNVETKDGKLVIKTLREKTTAPAWDPEKGMVMHPFEYTSDAINNASKLELEAGCVVMVKARCHGFLNHGIYLRSKKHVPFISVFNYTGLKLFCGVKCNAYTDENKHEIEGLQPITDIIYTVVWDQSTITWFVNNVKVYQTLNLIPKGEKLYLHLYSFLFKGKSNNTPGSLDVDWIRVYKKL